MPILTAQERLGTRIAGRYRIERMLATGGMSVLFEARDLRARRAVALKFLKAEDCAEERRKARFLEEMRLTAELRHPHVVDVLDLGEDADGIPYLVMELLRGGSLQAELDARGSLAFDEALAILLPVMEALNAVHAAGVVHRDIKPDNIFLHVDSRGAIVPKLLDFGIAKSANTMLATRTGAVLGTPDYMAPEQLLAGTVGPAADIWGVGAVFYRALHGRTPFHAPTEAEVIALLTREPAPPLRVDGLGPPICAVIDRALARDPGERYAGMASFATALRLCAREAGFAIAEEPVAPLVHGLSASAPQRTLTAASRTFAPLFERRRWPWVIAIASLALLILAGSVWRGGGAANASPTHAEEPRTVAVGREPVPQPAPIATNPLHSPSEVQAPATVVAPVTAGSASAAPARQAEIAMRAAPRASRTRRSGGEVSGSSTRREAVTQAEAVPPTARFSHQPGAGDLPIAVRW